MLPVVWRQVLWSSPNLCKYKFPLSKLNNANHNTVKDKSKLERKCSHSVLEKHMEILHCLVVQLLLLIYLTVMANTRSVCRGVPYWIYKSQATTLPPLRRQCAFCPFAFLPGCHCSCYQNTGTFPPKTVQHSAMQFMQYWLLERFDIYCTSFGDSPHPWILRVLVGHFVFVYDALFTQKEVNN